jgi:glycine/D-amino acid oxidase-like deaminating enzyme
LVLSYVETYYRRRLGDAPARAALEGRLEVEVCVIGAGLAGLHTALELARAGRRVAVLEAERIAWGASGRNGGFVGPGYSAGFEAIARHVGADDARTLHRMSIEGVQVVADNIALAITAADPVMGAMSAARFEAGEALRRQQDWLMAEFDYPTEVWERDRVREALASPRYHQAIFRPNAFHFDPLGYSRALADEIERLGGLIFEASPATGIGQEGAERRVSTPGGAVRVKDVVVATGGYTGRLLGRLFSSYLPVATYVMLTRPDPELIASAIRTTAAVGDHRRAGDYYRVVDGGTRILWGGKITTRTGEPRRLAALLHRTMVSTYPQLRGLEVDIAWTGLMAYARHRAPQIGSLGPGLWFCTAFGGHGMNTTAIGGRVIAEAITGQSDRYRLFAPFGLTWNGGPAGRAAVQATYWALQAQDAWNERARIQKAPG